MLGVTFLVFIVMYQAGDPAILMASPDAIVRILSSYALRSGWTVPGTAAVRGLSGWRRPGRFWRPVRESRVQPDGGGCHNDYLALAKCSCSVW